MKHNVLHLKSNLPDYLEQLFYKNNNEKAVLCQTLKNLLGNQHFSTGLDIGAGPGLLSQSLYDRCDHLTLLEIIPDYKNTLEEKYPKATVVIKSFIDFCSTQKYDIILCSHVLYYFDNSQLEQVLHKMKNMLNPGGLLSIILLDCTELLDYFSPKLSSIFGVNFISIKSFKQNLKKLGRVESIIYRTEKIFDTEQEFVDYLYGFFALKNKNDLLNCQDEITKAKQILEKCNHHFILHQSGEILQVRDCRTT